MSKFEHVIKTYLDRNCSRMLAVSDPVLLTIENLKSSIPIKAPYFPSDSSKGHYDVHLTPKVFVERFDILENLDSKTRVIGISEGSLFRLKYGPVLKVSRLIRDSNSKVVEIKAQLTDDQDPNSHSKDKVILNWVSEEDSVSCTLRLYDQLFVVEKPTQPADDPVARKAELNPSSLIVHDKAIVCRSVLNHIKERDRFQFERLGYFALDHKDSSVDLKTLVFNRIMKSQPSKPRES